MKPDGVRRIEKIDRNGWKSVPVEFRRNLPRIAVMQDVPNELLMKVSENAAWHEWVIFFLRGVEEAGPRCHC